MSNDKHRNIHQALTDKFDRKKTLAKDMNRIHQFYQTNKMIHKIHTDFTNFNNIDNQNIQLNNKLNIQLNIHRLRQKNIHIIHNVYQESYFENKKATGLGDFIRGCYFLIQFCKKYNFHFNIILNHPLALFLEKYHKFYYMKQHFNKKLFSSIQKFDPNNWISSEMDSNNYLVRFEKSESILGDITAYFNQLPVIQNNIFAYNCMFPYDTIMDSEKTILREIFEPSAEMKGFIEKSLDSMGLSVKNYSVIHIRSGDAYLFEETKIFDSIYFKNLCKNVEEILLLDSSITNYLFIADNNEIKYLLCQKFPNVKVLYNGISHFGEGKVLEFHKIRDTMLDFYLIANSAAIYSFTNYIHGSGFSLWCSVTYNIPYLCKLIKTK